MLFSQKLKKSCLNLIKFKNSNNSENLDNSQQRLLQNAFDQSIAARDNVGLDTGSDLVVSNNLGLENISQINAEMINKDNIYDAELMAIYDRERMERLIASLNEELLTAVKQFDLAKVKILLDKGANPNMFDNNQVPLILLIVNMYTDAKSAELLKLLINHSRYKFNLDQQDEQGKTALMYLVSSSVKTKDQIEVLLQAGADVNIRNHAHETVMDIAKKLYRHVTYDILNNCSRAAKISNLLDQEAFKIGARLAKIKYRKEFLGETFFDKNFAKKNHNHLKRLSDDIIQNIGLYLYSRSRVTLEFMDGFFSKKQKYQKLYAKKMLKAER